MHFSNHKSSLVMDLTTPLPGVLEGLLGHHQTSQLSLHSGEQEKVCWGEVQRIGQVGDHPHALRHQEVHNRDSGVDRSIVPMQPPLLRGHYRSLVSENFQKSGQGSLDVGGIDDFALLDKVCEDNSLHIKDNENHLLCPRSMHLCLQRAWLALFHPLLRLPLCLRGKK
jgi:hypothetical protein